MEQQNNADWRSVYTRVLGQSLNRFVGQSVLLLGEVSSVHGNGSSIILKSTDNVNVTVQLPQDLMEPPQGLVELRGTVVNGNTFNCEELTQFETQVADFDAETYTEAVRLIMEGDTPWTRK